MTQGDLNRLRKTHSFLARIQATIPDEGETILSMHLGEVAFYEAIFPASLRFSIHPTIRRILDFYNICPAQLSPNAWWCVICILVIWRYYKRHLSFNEFSCLTHYSKVRSQTRGGFTYKRGRSKGGRIDFSSAREMIGSFFRAWLRVKLYGSWGHGVPQVNLISILLYLLKYIISP